MAQPTNIKLESVEPKRSIDLHSGLRSLLRAWLTARDMAIFSLVSGMEASDGPTLEKVDWNQASPAVATMNLIREEAYNFAARINERNAESVLRAELNSLLSEETPKFLLRVDGVQGSF